MLFVSTAKVVSSTPHNPSRGFSEKMALWEVHNSRGASLTTAKTYRTVGDLLILEYAIWDIEFEVNDTINGELNNTNSNTG